MRANNYSPLPSVANFFIRRGGLYVRPFAYRRILNTGGHKARPYKCEFDVIPQGQMIIRPRLIFR
jgi:hypothetical protein